MSTDAHFYLIAGEPSGDKLGASLMVGLKTLAPDTKFSGVGGPLMQAEGLDSLFAIEELSVMGIFEVLPRLPKLLSRIRETADVITKLSPDAVITIDSPDFCLRVLSRVRASDKTLKTIHYVAPTVWAWRPERAAKMARYVDHVLALFPFEPPYMQAEGMGCDFVGHPVVAETTPSLGDIERFRAELKIAPDEPLLLVLPGSRNGEVARMEPVSFKAKDGLTVHGYLTTPAGIPAKNLPMILNVHGGPWARDKWGFDTEAQWLANRGYAVLQVNYRGSTGYGKTFLNAANREWAGKMHQDLIDGVDWVVKKGIADPKRVAIFGGSYGGYIYIKIRVRYSHSNWIRLGRPADDYNHG